MKKSLIALIVIIIVGLGAYFLLKNAPEAEPVTPGTPTTTTQNGEPQAPVDDTRTVLGKSVEGRDIVAYHYGEGDTELLFVGGIHGGYEWNTALVAYELMDYLETDAKIPANVKVTVVPVLNPDGLNKVVGTTENFTAADVPTEAGATIPGRFNANNVDLNRNFDCEWQAKGVWQNREVSGGSTYFSEPESEAIRQYVESREIAAAVVYYSAAGGVYASNCRAGVLPETREIMNAYATASGYPAHESFDYYAITGDMVNWLAKEGVPGISVLLTTHNDTEWTKNQKGVDALLSRFAE